MAHLCGLKGICVLLLVATAWITPETRATDGPVHGQTVTLEDFGGRAFYRPFLGWSQLEAGRWSLGLLNVYPLESG